MGQSKRARDEEESSEEEMEHNQEEEEEEEEAPRPERVPPKKSKPTKANAAERAETEAGSRKKRKQDTRPFQDAEDYLLKIYNDLFAAKSKTPEEEDFIGGWEVFCKKMKSLITGANKLVIDKDDNYSHLLQLCKVACSLDFTRTKNKDVTIAVFGSVADKEVRYPIHSKCTRFVATLFLVLHLEKYVVMKIKQACEARIILKDFIEQTPLTLLEMHGGKFHRGLAQKLVTQISNLEKDLLTIAEGATAGGEAEESNEAEEADSE